MKTTTKKNQKNQSQNSMTPAGFTRVRDYKRAMRKQFNEMRKSMTEFTSGMEGMPAKERQQVKNMIRTVDATRSQLTKWWS